MTDHLPDHYSKVPEHSKGTLCGLVYGGTGWGADDRVLMDRLDADQVSCTSCLDRAARHDHDFGTDCNVECSRFPYVRERVAKAEDRVREIPVGLLRDDL